MKNIEIKYQVPSLQDIYSFASGHPDIRYEWKKEQTDIYYKVPEGQLKLRLQSDSDHELIFYRRQSSLKPRESEYYIYSCPDMTKLKHLLDKAFGSLAQVHKTRTLFMFRNIRIHLDVVEGAGEFIEFESVVDHLTDEEAAQKNLNELLGQFHSFSLKPVPVSYAQLLDK
ncbi:MAG: CYTH domain-containing protein [Calditrichaeota bacterium]|nr:class IV adenylate cyclase [Calditrichota bacterium]RQW02261.1 MAG: CYTH domain-containing protein [Calditrichota bacterium]